MSKNAPQLILQSPQKIEELESIRGVAAFLVIFFHLPKWHPVMNVGFVNNGYLMVDLFFVISGFVIYNAYSGKINGGRDLLRFQFLRFGRLYPVHILFLFAFLIIEIAKYLAALRLGIISPNSFPFQVNNLSAFLQNLFLVSALIPDANSTFNYPAWSISAEFYTYLIFAATALAFKKNKSSVFFLLAFGSLILLSTGNTFGLERLLRCFTGFFVGCLTARMVKNASFKLPLFASVLMFIAIIAFIQLKVNKNFDPLIYFLTAALIVSLVLSEDGLMKRILRFRFSTWLGTISYSVYMSHAAVEWLVNQVIRVALKKHEIVGADGASTPQLSQWEALFACFVVSIIVLMASAVVFNFVEKPMRERSRRFATNNLAA